MAGRSPAPGSARRRRPLLCSRFRRNHHHGNRRRAGTPSFPALEADLAASPDRGATDSRQCQHGVAVAPGPPALPGQAARPARRPSRAADTGVRSTRGWNIRSGNSRCSIFDDDGRLHRRGIPRPSVDPIRRPNPSMVEEPFVIALADLVVTGADRCDLPRPRRRPVRWEVVDWKTGSRAGADRSRNWRCTGPHGPAGSAARAGAGAF